jgi:hypothetical protein
MLIMQGYGNILEEMGLKRMGDIPPHYFPLDEFGKIQMATDLRGLESPETISLGVYESKTPIEIERIKGELRDWNLEQYGVLEIQEPEKWNILFPSPRDEKVPTFQLPNSRRGKSMPLNWMRSYIDRHGRGYYRIYDSSGEKMGSCFYPNYDFIKVSLGEKNENPVLVILSVDESWRSSPTRSKKIYDVWFTETMKPKDVEIPYFAQKAL